ncbi:hypothetical protein KP509_36G029600 [Ceratopteris richardii]|uniref:Uncharacterized protein n=1 Tax=Ceratopteris richardii TaxID=49495 RepID=A0A8T2QC81_CERRI|nr:hypothetical protein KP509_36G029600 [Ceratopteris richardii]
MRAKVQEDATHCGFCYNNRFRYRSSPEPLSIYFGSLGTPQLLKMNTQSASWKSLGRMLILLYCSIVKDEHTVSFMEIPRKNVDTLVLFWNVKFPIWLEVCTWYNRRAKDGIPP